MSDIQSLTIRAHEFGEKVDWWNNAMVGALLGAAIAAVFVVVATRMVIYRAGQLAQVQDEIIAAVNQKAGQASERAAKLEVEAAGLRLQLDQEIQKRAARTLTTEQRAIMAAELKGKISKVTFVVQKDPEARAFALQLEVIFQEAGAEISVFEMAPGEVTLIPAVMMYKPGGITAENELKDDPVYKALKKAKLFGGTAAQPFTSLERGPQAPTLPADGYVLYVSQKMPW